MLLSNKTMKILSLICIAALVVGCLPCQAAASGAAADFAAVLCEEMLTNELSYAITENLDLDLSDELPEGVTVSFESSSNAIAVDTEVAHVLRNLYHDIPVKLIAKVSDSTTSVTKELNFTVLQRTTDVYLSENFYYPGDNGVILTEAQSIKKSEITPTPTILSSEGWSFAYTTELSEETANGQRFKSVIDALNGSYALKSYRNSAVDTDYNYTRYVFGEKPTGEVSIKADITFDHEPGNQIYVFRALGNYDVNGTNERARIFEINYKYNAEGASSINMSYYDGAEITSANVSAEDMPSPGETAQIEWQLDTENQVWNMYIDGMLVTESSVPFYERDKEGADRTDFISVNDIDFNIYRGYSGGVVYIDNILVTGKAYESDSTLFNITEEMLTNEPQDVITKDLDLDLSDVLPSGVSVSFESDSDAIVIDNTVARIYRDTYRDTSAVITATLTDGTDTWKKKLYFTIPRDTTKVYMSENFYYPKGKGMILYDVTEIERSEITPTPPTAGDYGWSSRYQTHLSDDTTTGQRFKSLIDCENDKYVLRSYRPVAVEEHNYTYYVFGEKPNGDVTIRSRMKFVHEPGTQIYVFRFYGNFTVNGETKLVTVNETNFHYTADGAYRIYMPYIEGESSKTLQFSKEQMPAVGEWAEVEWRFYSQDRTLDLYINDVRVNEEPIVFFDTMQNDVDRTHFTGYNNFEFNSYRQYAGGSIYIDEISATSNPEWYNKNPEVFYVYNNLWESVLTDEDSNAISTDLNFFDNEVINYAEEKGVAVTYMSSNPDVIAPDGTVNRAKYDTPVTIIATISKNGASIDKEFNFTVLCIEEYIKLSTFAKKLTEEALTEESPKFITKDFSLSFDRITGVDYSDINVSFISGDSSILELDEEENKCIVHRKPEDATATLTALITQDGKELSITKELVYTVTGTDKKIYYSDSFYYPESTGERISTVRSDIWKETSVASDSYYFNEVSVQNNNYHVKTYRTDTSGSQNFIRYTFPDETQYKVSYEIDLKMDHTKTPQYYFFMLYGNYLNEDGETENTNIVDLNFYYEGYKEHLFTRREISKGDARSVTLTEELPPLGEWFTLKVEVNTAEKTADYYINGEKLNDTPVELYYHFTKSGQPLINVSELRLTAYREQSGVMSFDNFSAYTLASDVNANYAFYSGGERITAIEEALDGKIDAEVALFNQSSLSKTLTVCMAEFQGDTMTNIKLKKVELDTDINTVEKALFEDFILSSNPENSVIKVYVWDSGKMYPYVAELPFTNALNREIIPGQITCDKSGRTYNYVDFDGENMIRSYFTMQGWSNDSEKFYVRDDDFRIYEYNTITNRVKYIDTGKYEHTLVTTPLNGLFYVNRYNEIIRMDIDTYEKRVVGAIPSEYADNAGMLQVMDTEEKLSVEWTDKQLKEGSRFPVLDIETGEWDLSHNYVFETEWYNPNHVSINPVKSNLLLFCHEGTVVNDRLWVVDMNTDSYYNVFVSRMFNSTSAGEIACHEMWTHDGEHIVFHKSSSTSAIGYPGIVSVKYDGTDRRYINSDYSYNHVATSPVSNRWAVADTGYTNGETSDIVLIDCYTGESHHLARVRQTGVNPGHCHPAFSQDGKKVWFGHYDESGTIIRIGWMDVSDIVENAPEGGWYDLSSSCESFSYEGTDSEVAEVSHSAQALYELPSGNIMRINVKSSAVYAESADAEVTLTYLDEGTDDFKFTYYTFEAGETRNRLIKNTKTVSRTGSGGLKTETFILKGVCLDNMERLGTDFTISSNSSVKIASVTAELVQ